MQAERESPVTCDFFDLPRQKKDSAVSLSEHDANSPRPAIFLSKQNSAEPTVTNGFDFEKEDVADEDLFNPLEYPVKKRSLSNGDSFFAKKDDEDFKEALPDKLAVTASDPDSSGQ